MTDKIRNLLADVRAVYEGKGMVVHPNSFDRLRTEVMKLDNLNRLQQEQIEKTKYLEQLLKDIIASSGDDREELLKKAEHFLNSEEDGDKSILEMFGGEKHLNPNYNNETTKGYVVPNDILGLWEQTVCEIRHEIKAQDTPALAYAKGLCDKLEHSMCALAGGPYKLKYSIEEDADDN